MTQARFAAVSSDDFEALLALRIAALRPSLERLGRFDPQRARQRFLAGFEPASMRHILVGEKRVGLLTLKHDDAENRLRIEHLYIDPAWQGQGLGAWALREAQGEAGERAIELDVLRESDANRFYMRHGFVPIGEDVWDVRYRWQAAVATTT